MNHILVSTMTHCSQMDFNNPYVVQKTANTVRRVTLTMHTDWFFFLSSTNESNSKILY